jgi:EmrB/QacA subfamily drug resistance transporter
MNLTKGKIKKETNKNTQTTTNQTPTSHYASSVLITITAVALLINYVETMVIPGLPAIQTDLNTTANIASWVTSALLIVGATSAPLFGKLGDNYGKKKMLLIAIVFYMFGVGIAGFAPNIFVLIFARAIQGVGFAVIPLGISIITDTFPRERIATAQGIISSTFAVGAALGLVLGAYIIQSLSWHYAFYIALVLSVVMLTVVSKTLKKDTEHPKNPIDYTGGTLLVAGIALILIYLTEGTELGWLSIQEILLVVIGATLIGTFVIYENKTKYPLIKLSLLKIRNVLVANLVGIISGIVMFLLFISVVYLAELPAPFGLGLGVIETGLTLAPATIVGLFLGPVIGKAVTKIGPKPVIALSGSITIIGLFLFILNRSTQLFVVLDVAVALSGATTMVIPIVNMISVSVPKESRATGLGLNTMLRNVGGAIGPILATTTMATYTSPLIIKVQGTSQVVGTLPNATAFNTIFIIGIILTFLVIALSFAIKNYRITKEATTQPNYDTTKPEPRQ